MTEFTKIKKRGYVLQMGVEAHSIFFADAPQRKGHYEPVTPYGEMELVA